MIRVNFAMRRRADLGLAAFQQIWRERHGPLVASHSHDLGIHRYVQSHADPDDPLGRLLRARRVGLDAAYDGLETLWFESPESLAAALDRATGAEQQIVASERDFVDLARSAIWVSGEYGMINASAGLVARPAGPYVKLVALLDPRPGMTLEAFYRHWTFQHASLARRAAALTGLHRYLQSPTLDDPLNARLREVRGGGAPHLALSECWYHRATFLAEAASPDSPIARIGPIMIEDEARFIDLGRLSFTVTREHVFIDGDIG